MKLIRCGIVILFSSFVISCSDGGFEASSNLNEPAPPSSGNPVTEPEDNNLLKVNYIGFKSGATQSYTEILDIENTTSILIDESPTSGDLLILLKDCDPTLDVYIELVHRTSGIRKALARTLDCSALKGSGQILEPSFSFIEKNFSAGFYIDLYQKVDMSDRLRIAKVSYNHVFKILKTVVDYTDVPSRSFPSLTSTTVKKDFNSKMFKIDVYTSSSRFFNQSAEVDGEISIGGKTLAVRSVADNGLLLFTHNSTDLIGAGMNMNFKVKTEVGAIFESISTFITPPTKEYHFTDLNEYHFRLYDYAPVPFNCLPVDGNPSTLVEAQVDPVDTNDGNMTFKILKHSSDPALMQGHICSPANPNTYSHEVVVKI